MTVSDAEFLAWCKQGHRADRVCTIELDRVEEVGGEPETQTLYVSDKPYRQSSTRYHAIIQSVPEFYRELGGDRRSVYSSSYGSILLVSRGGSFDWLLDAALDGSEARFRLGDVAWSIDDHRIMFVALQVMAQRADPDTLEIQIQDRALTLNKSISGQILVGGTGPNADKPRKFNFGNVRQVECDLVDAGSLTYAHSDTGTNTVATAVYDRLTPVGYTDNGDGTQTLDASPDGIITADVVATAPDADPSDVTRHLTSDLIDVSVGLRSGLIAAGVYAGAHPTFTVGDDQDWPIGSSVNDTRNTFDFLADAAKSGQFAYAFTRLGLFTYGRIRPNDIATLPVTPFDIVKDDIGFSEGIEVTHDVPGYYRIQAICDKNWTHTDDVATGLDPDDRALRTRKGLYLKQDDAVGDTYADKPELYDLTLVESPIIETLVSGDGDDTEDEPILASWMEVERFNGLPWLERVQRINVGIEFYEQELMDVARLTFPRFGFDAGELTQVIGVRTKLTEAKIEFTLLRRRLSQPYPFGWERVTTGTDAITVSSFDFDSVAPPIVVPPPGPPLPPGIPPSPPPVVPPWIDVTGPPVTPPSGPPTLLAGNDNFSVIKSTDGGATWGSEVTVFGSGFGIISGLIQLANGNIVALSSEGLVSTSVDGGSTWGTAEAVLSSPLFVSGNSVGNALGYDLNETLVFGVHNNSTDDGYIYGSASNGASSTWSSRLHATNNGNFRGFRLNVGNFIALQENGNIYNSTTGTSWVGPHVVSGITSAQALTATIPTNFAVGGLAGSTNVLTTSTASGGSVWSSTTNMTGMTGFITSMNYCGGVYLAGSTQTFVGKKLWYSSDGVAWTLSYTFGSGEFPMFITVIGGLFWVGVYHNDDTSALITSADGVTWSTELPIPGTDGVVNFIETMIELT